MLVVEYFNYNANISQSVKTVNSSFKAFMFYYWKNLLESMCMFFKEYHQINLLVKDYLVMNVIASMINENKFVSTDKQQKQIIREIIFINHKLNVKHIM